MRALLVTTVAFVATLFHLYSAGVSPFTALVQRPVHLGLMAVLGFLGVTRVARDDRPRWQRDVLDPTLAVAALVTCAYPAFQNRALVERAGLPTSLDIALGALLIVLVLELARRTVGGGLVAVAVAALAYSQLGPWLPSFLAHRGYSPTRVIEHVFLSTEGIWGVPLGVSADFVFLFVLFGVLLETAGGGELLIALARRVAGRTLGGPAKTAAVASALMGSLSGSAVANVVTTGTLTIPLMKRANFPATIAGAIEAAASTGGQLMPPVMGAGAFILATWTNVPYLEVASRALAPALLYYVALLLAIHFSAARDGVGASTADAAPVLPRLHLLLPLAVVVVALAAGRSPMRAAFWGSVIAALSALALPATRPTWKQWVGIPTMAARGAVQVAAACAAAGIVVGVATLTGIGLRMSELIVTLSGGSLLIGLVWTALGSIILGMGLPTTAAYVVLAALGAPALVELGAPLLAAHLFIFYFGCMSNVTPPVSLAAYAAAGIANAPPFATARAAVGFASVGFLVPFAFVLEPELILQGAVGPVALTLSTAALGCLSLAAAVVGFHNRRLALAERSALAGAALGLFLSWWPARLLGLAVLLGSLVWNRGTRS